MATFGEMFNGPGFGAYGELKKTKKGVYVDCPEPVGPHDFRCLKCHFEYEEKHAFPHLPPKLRARLAEDHKKIIARMRHGLMPLELIAEHRELESAIFPIFLPPAAHATIENDHKIYSKAFFCDQKFHKRLYL